MKDLKVDYDFELSVFKQLQECYEENQGYISKYIYEKSKRKPSASSIARYFGNWTTALEAVGIGVQYPRPYTDEEIQNALLQFCMENPENVSSEAYAKSGRKPSTWTIIDRHGSWRNALDSVGISIENKKCPSCNNSFVKKQVTQKFCSRTCMKKFHDNSSRKQRVLLGRCYRCGSSLDMPGKTRCSACLKLMRKYQKKYRNSKST